MAQRFAIIPGYDPEVTVHGPMPALAEAVASRGISALDLRDDREKFADLANPIIDAFPDKLAGTWWRFNSIACTLPDAQVHNRLVFHAGLPVVGISNLQWEQRATHLAQEGNLKIERAETHFPGRTGLIAGRSAFNYYHYLSDMLIFLEDLVAVADTLELDRILFNPCRGDDGGFQKALVRELYPNLSKRIQFFEGPFSTDELTFVCVWPDYFAPPEENEPVRLNGIKGVSRRAFRRASTPFFERAERYIGTRDFSDRKKVVLISRQHAPERKILNEDALRNMLAPYGVETVAMETLSIREQIELAASARVIIGAHGAGMVNGGFCQSGAACLELTGRHYLQRGPDFAALALIRDISYRFVIADEEGDIEQLKGNKGNDIRLSQSALEHIGFAVGAALDASCPEEAMAAFAATANAAIEVADT